MEKSVTTVKSLQMRTVHVKNDCDYFNININIIQTENEVLASE